MVENYVEVHVEVRSVAMENRRINHRSNSRILDVGGPDIVMWMFVCSYCRTRNLLAFPFVVWQCVEQRRYMYFSAVVHFECDCGTLNFVRLHVL